jgi:hypothetical protein
MILISYTPVTARLEGWEKDGRLPCVWGHIYDDVHKRWRRGADIRTSRIKDIKDMELQEGMIIQTLNSSYLLGKKGLDIT